MARATEGTPDTGFPEPDESRFALQDERDVGDEAASNSDGSTTGGEYSVPAGG
jgi:hypothetical protein